MLNSIVLSSDMERLYLIDDGRAIEFPLTEQGVLIGMLNGQLSVATAVKIPVPVDDDDVVEGEDDSFDDVVEDGRRDDNDESVNLGVERLPKAILPFPKPSLFPRKLKMSLLNSQWTFSFNPDKGYLFAIGATDIFFDRPEIVVKPRVHIFALRKGVMKLTKADKVINVTFMEGGK